MRQLLTEGYYATFLGASEPLPVDLFDGGSLYLQVMVEGDALTPRQEIGSVPYALTCQNLTGGTVDAASVRVNGSEVIASDGQWVGPRAPGAAFSDDTDADGAEDWIELAAGSDPADPASLPADGNGDGVYDVLVGPAPSEAQIQAAVSGMASLDVASLDGRPAAGWQDTLHWGRHLEAETAPMATTVNLGSVVADASASGGRSRKAAYGDPTGQFFGVSSLDLGEPISKATSAFELRLLRGGGP